jgi:hypothetical protein
MRLGYWIAAIGIQSKGEQTARKKALRTTLGMPPSEFDLAGEADILWSGNDRDPEEDDTCEDGQSLDDVSSRMKSTSHASFSTLFTRRENAADHFSQVVELERFVEKNGAEALRFGTGLLIAEGSAKDERHRPTRVSEPPEDLEPRTYRHSKVRDDEVEGTLGLLFPTDDVDEKPHAVRDLGYIVAVLPEGCGDQAAHFRVVFGDHDPWGNVGRSSRTRKRFERNRTYGVHSHAFGENLPRSTLQPPCQSAKDR